MLTEARHLPSTMIETPPLFNYEAPMQNIELNLRRLEKEIDLARLEGRIEQR